MAGKAAAGLRHEMEGLLRGELDQPLHAGGSRHRAPGNPRLRCRLRGRGNGVRAASTSEVLARGLQRTWQSTSPGLPALEPFVPVVALNVGGGVNCMPGFAGTMTGGCVGLAT
jgi:hypothetical protein